MDEPFLAQTIHESVKKTDIQLHKSHSAPALYSYTDETGIFQEYLANPRYQYKSTIPKISHLALLGLILYIIVGLTVFLFTSGMFKGQETLKLIDALYLIIASLCTIGYGDIVPTTTFSKLFISIFILVGFGFVILLLSGLVIYKQKQALFRTVVTNKNEEKAKLRSKIMICLNLGVIIFCLVVGTVAVHFIEELSWVDGFYLSVGSVTTVSYGDYTFKTVAGRCFAIVWILVSMFAVVRAFLCLIECRIGRSQCQMGKEVLQRKLTFGDAVEADMNHDGFISKAEYVIFKLKEIGKIREEDVLQICNQFDSLENAYNGKIKVSDLMGGDNEDEAVISFRRCGT